MPSFEPQIQWRELHKLKQPGKFFGAGLLAGVVLFLLWWALQPASEPAVPSVTVATAHGAQAPGAELGGVLGGITGPLSPGDPSIESIEDSAAMVVEEDVDPNINEAADRQDTFVEPAEDAEMEESDLVPGVDAPLQPWYVEVEREDGVVEQLEINARSPGHALSIVRDFRGDPRVLRGPSPQVLH